MRGASESTSDYRPINVSAFHSVLDHGSQLHNETEVEGHIAGSLEQPRCPTLVVNGPSTMGIEECHDWPAAILVN